MAMIPGCQYIVVAVEQLIAKSRLPRSEGCTECDCELLRGGKIARIAFEREDQE